MILNLFSALEMIVVDVLYWMMPLLERRQGSRFRESRALALLLPTRKMTSYLWTLHPQAVVQSSWSGGMQNNMIKLDSVVMRYCTVLRNLQHCTRS